MQPTWHLSMKTVSLSMSGLTVVFSHTHRETTTQRGRGRREEESRKGRVRERNGRVGGVREEERTHTSTILWYVCIHTRLASPCMALTCGTRPYLMSDGVALHSTSQQASATCSRSAQRCSDSGRGGRVSLRPHKWHADCVCVRASCPPSPTAMWRTR